MECVWNLSHRTSVVNSEELKHNYLVLLEKVYFIVELEEAIYLK